MNNTGNIMSVKDDIINSKVLKTTKNLFSSLKKAVLRLVFRCMKINCRINFNLKNLPEKAIFISNHVSFLDPILLYAFLPGKPFFALNSCLMRKKWVRFFLENSSIVEFNPLDPVSIKRVLARVEAGEKCLIFPEGRLTKNGGLMKIYEAPGVIADKAKAPIIPVWIDGMEYSRYFSMLKDKLHLRSFPKTLIIIDKPVDFKISDNLRKQRDYISNEIRKIMTNVEFNTLFNSKDSVFSMLMKASKLHGKSGVFERPNFLEDDKREAKTFKDIIVESFIFGDYFNKHFKNQERVGVLLPNSCDNLITFFGLVAYERVPAMLNFSTGIANILSMCRTAVINNVISSSEFIENNNLNELVSVLSREGIKFTYVEDIKSRAGIKVKFKAYIDYKKKRIPYKNSGGKDCVVLFTSGSEGTPKGVVLTHSNINANVYQLKCIVDVNNTDVIFNILPMFHSFGLTVGTLFPILMGGKVFLYPSPLHYRVIPELIYEIGATMMFGTDTFFRCYAKVAHPYDFNNMRFMLGGAEAVRADTRNTWMERFGVRLLEGYGATECTPIITFNTLLTCKFGSIGQILPAIEYKFEPVDGIENGGILCVKGPNVMKGYIKSDKPGELVPLEDEWYNTGDVVEVDSAGYFYIKDRLKRFAKIGGEMVSLTAVEGIASKCFNDAEFLYGAVAIQHETKGEQIVLTTNNRDLTIEKLQSYIKNNGITELFLPKIILYRDELPLTASGKRNNLELKKQVLEELKIN